MEKTARVRPYWQVDAKWLCGLLSLVALGGGLLLLTLATATGPDRGVELSATVMASLVSKDGLDGPIDTSQLRQRLSQSRTGKIAPLAEFPMVQISAADLELKPRALRLKIFGQIARPIYEEGLEAAAKRFTSNPVEQKQFEGQAAALGLLTRKNHDRLLQMAEIALGVAVLAMVGVIGFSWRWGRLASPGLILVVAGVPGLVVGIVLGQVGSGAGSGGGVVVEVLKAIRDSGSLYPSVAMVGGGLVLLAGMGRLVTAVARGRNGAAVRVPNQGQA